MSQRGFWENAESWKRHDLGLVQLVLSGRGGGGQLGSAGGGMGTSPCWRDGFEGWYQGYGWAAWWHLALVTSSLPPEVHHQSLVTSD